MSNQRRDILSEEEYTSTLSSIVQRDYFPDIPNLEKQAAVLSRRQLNDFKGAVAVRRAARKLQQHETDLAEQEEVEETSLDAGNLRKKPRSLNRESITGFHARVTSEDNHEFEQNLQNELRAKKSRIEDIYRSRLLSIEESNKDRYSETPLLASDQFTAPNYSIKARTNSKSDNGFFFAPKLDKKDDELLDTMLLKEGFDNTHMPPPRRLPKSSTKISLSKQNLVEYIPKKSLEKHIETSQTRFTADTTAAFEKRDFDQNNFESSDYSTDASTDFDAPVLPVDVERKKFTRKKKQDLETLVAMTPLLEPRANASPITTWGVVSSTPLVLGGDKEVIKPSFELRDRSSREIAAREAEEKLVQRRAKMLYNKKKAQNEIGTPLTDRIASLTPAARSLLNRSNPKNYCAVRSSSAFANALRKSYTPKRQPSSSRINIRQATPRASIEGERSSHYRAPGHVTDGLLDLS